MKSGTISFLLRLYPPGWRKRYGDEFAALLQDHPFSVRAVFDVVKSACEAHVVRNANEAGLAEFIAWIWCAWMLALAAGMILYGTVDDSPLVSAMHRSLLFGVCWAAIAGAALLAAAVIALAGFPVAWSALRYSLHRHRWVLLAKMAFPLMTALLFISWVVVVSLWTGGRWGASPWALGFPRPDWPSESFRWITGLISAVLLVLAYGGSALMIFQVLRSTEFLELRIPMTQIGIQPLRFATALAP